MRITKKSHRRARRRARMMLAMAAVAACIGSGPAAEAATTVWIGASGGNWNNNTNWSANQPTTANEGRFPLGNPGIVVLSNGRVANSLLFLDDYLLQSGNLTLNNGTITTDTGTTVTISSPLLASGGFGINGLTKDGDGTLTLSGVNTFQGDVTLNAGTLSVSADTRLGNAANDVNITNGTLRITATMATSRSITMSGAAATINATAGPLSISGALDMSAVGATVNVTAGSLTINGALDVTSGQVNSADASIDGSVTINSANSDWTANSQVDVGTVGHGVMTIQAGGSASATSNVLGNGVGSFGEALIDGSGSTWTASSQLVVGFGGKGVLTVQNGADISSDLSHIGSVAGSTGTATVTGAGSTWINTGILGVGYSGSGTLNILAGGNVTTSSTFVAADPGSRGTVNITGTGSTWSAGSPVIGERGLGTLTISAGGTLASDGGFIGLAAGSTGTVTVTGAGSTWTNGTGTLTVAGSGNATLTVAAGGAVGNGFATVGSNSGSSGTVTVTGPGSSWTNVGELSIGGSGSGALNILAGGAVSDTIGHVGSSAPGTANATINGTGSTWTHSVDLSIGQSGTGAMRIEAGGSVSNVIAYLGRFGSGSGTATVTGAGSLWTSTSQMLVGYQGGRGLLNIENGGTVTTPLAQVGSSNGTGTVNITGTGSTWNINGGSQPSLAVGTGGTGTVSISAGGSLFCSDLMLAPSSGDVGTINVSGAGSLCAISGQLEFGFSGGSGTGTLNITGGTVTVGSIGINDYGGSSTLTLDGGTLDMQNLAIGGATTLIDNLNFRAGTLKNVTQINNGAGLTKTTAGTLTLDGTNTYTGVTTVSAGMLIFKTTYKTGSGIDIAAGANAQIAQSIATPNNVVLKTPSINTNTTGRLDIRDNKIITSAAVGTWNGSQYTGITGQIQHGRNSIPLKWSGGGIVTSMSDATGSNYTSVAVARGVEVKPATASVTALWGGQTITGTDTLVMYTYAGDANLDGKLNVDDYVRIDSNVGLWPTNNGVAAWFNGDFNYDGKINVDDYVIIDSNIGIAQPPFPTGSGAGEPQWAVNSVPEPSVAALGCVAFGFAALRRRRRGQLASGRTAARADARSDAGAAPLIFTDELRGALLLSIASCDNPAEKKWLNGAHARHSALASAQFVTHT